MLYETTHARHDRAHCLCPGLFRSFVNGERRKVPLFVTYTYGDETIEISGPELLGPFDLRVLQGLVALAGKYGKTIDMKQPATAVGQLLVDLLDPMGVSSKQTAISIKSSFYRIALEIGLANPNGGKEARMIRESVERLWKTSVIVTKGKRRTGYRILGDNYDSDLDTKEGKLDVSLNPRIATAILGDQHARIDMNEVRALDTPAARLIHQRLCGYIDQGKAHPTPIAEETLFGYIWHDAPVDPKSSTFRMRRGVLKTALGELEAQGWKIVPEKGRDPETRLFTYGYRIWRPEGGLFPSGN